MKVDQTSSKSSLVSRNSSMAGITMADNVVRDEPKKRLKKIADSATSGASYTELDDSQSEKEVNLGGWEIAADRFSQNSDTSGEGPQGHHKELEVSISDILDRGDPR